MSSTQYPTLGFDPARGDVATVNSLAEQLTGTASYAESAHDALMSIKNNSDVWTGDAAKAFAETIEDLPGYLDDAHRSFERSGKALSQWANTLADHQQRARELEDRARRAVGDARQASESADDARMRASASISYDPNDPASVESARLQADKLDEAAKKATQQAEQAWGDVEDIRRQAEQLLHTWKDDAAACARVLRDAGEVAPDEGFFEKVGEFIVDNLGTIGDIAGIISAIAGILSFVPGLNFIAAPVALISGAVALGAHAADISIEGKWDDPMSYVTLAGDALGLVPGLGALGKGAGEVVDVASTGVRMFADDAASAAGKLASTADEVATTGVKGAMNSLNAGTVSVDVSRATKVIESSVDATLQTPTAVGLATPGTNETVGGFKDAATSVTATKNAADVISVIGQLR